MGGTQDKGGERINRVIRVAVGGPEDINKEMTREHKHGKHAFEMIHKVGKEG